MSADNTDFKALEAQVTEEVTPENFAVVFSLFDHYIRTDPMQALVFINKAHKLAVALNTLPQLSLVWYGLGVVNLLLGQSKKAVPYLKKAVKALDELGDVTKKTRARGNLANALSDLGQLDKAERQYKILLKDFLSLGDSISLARTHYNLGNLQMKINKFADALQSYQTALKLYGENSDAAGKANALCMLGAAYARLFDYEKNLQCAQQALEVVEKEDNPYLVGAVYTALGNANLFIHQHDKAAEYYHKSLEIGRSFGISTHIASNLTNLAEVMTISKDYDLALSYAKEALDYDKKNDVAHYLAQDYYMLGRVHHLRKEWDKSVRHINKAMQMAGDAGMTEIWISAANVQIFNYAHMGEFAKGCKLWDKLEETVKDDQLSETYIIAMEGGSVLFSAMGDFQRSNDCLTKYHDLTKEHITQESQRRVQYLQMTWETERREQEKLWLAKQNKLLEKRIKQELKKIREKDKLLAEQENMALVGRITAGIAHELNNPLAAIKQAVEITLESLTNEMSGELYLSKKQTDIYKMLKRINRLVEIVKVIAHSPDRFTSRPFRINDIVTEFTELFSDRILGDDVALVTDLQDKLPDVEGDAIRFIQVISILVHNANDALSTLKAGHRKIVIRTYESGGNLIMEVSDNGPGMSADLLTKVKLPFFSTKDVDKGMGMGLSIATAIVNNMKGELSIKSVVGTGTTVVVTIPALRRAEKRS